MDLDGFKQVNDEHGHHVGDEILIKFAAELNIVLPEDSIAARWGGDEFVVILNCAEQGCAEKLAQILRERFKKPFNTSAGAIFLGCSIGVSTRCEKLSVADCVKIADAKMYEQKQARKTGNDQSTQAEEFLVPGMKRTA